MVKYDSYKDSGVEWIGEIPNHWEIKRLEWISEIENSGVWGEDEPFEGSMKVPIPTTGQLSIEGNWYYDKMKTRNISIQDWEVYKCIKGDIIVVKSSGSSTNIITGKCGFIRKKDSERFGFSNFLMRVRPTKLLPKLTYYFLQSNITKQRIEKMVSSTTYPNLKVDEYSKSTLFIPPPQEQQQIVSFLDTKTSLVDSLIEKTQKKIELLKEKRTSLINHTVTKGLNPNVEMKDSGVEWIGEIPSHWDYIPFKYFTIDKNGIQTGPFGTQLNTKDYVKSGVKVMNQKTLINENYSLGDEFISYVKYENLKVFEVIKGDIIMGTRGSFGNGKRTTFGKVSIVPEGLGDCVLHPCLIRIRMKENKMLKPYLYYYINESSLFLDDIKITSNSTTIEVIYGVTLKDIKFPVPPIEEQNQILEYLDEQTNIIDTTITKEQKRIKLLKEYRQSLISEVITGKIKVTNE